MKPAPPDGTPSPKFNHNSLMFIGVVIAMGLLVARIAPRLAQRAMMPRGPALMTAGYGIGSVAVFWMIQRLALF